MKKVIDSSVAFKWVVVESDRPKAIRLRDDYQNALLELLAPDHFPTEVANALRVSERRGRIRPGQGIVLLGDVIRVLPVLCPVLPDLLPRAYQIAALSNASIYDCLYVSLAEREGCEMVTADDRLVRNLQGQYPFVVALSSLP